MTEKVKQKHLARWSIMVAMNVVGWLPLLPAQQLNLAFQRLDRDKGLSQGTCPFVSRDSKGFVWIATVDGLNRFDGKNIKVYRPNPSTPHSLVGNILTSACYEDAQTSDLWFTTYNAVHRYVRDYDHFDTFQLKDSARNPLVEDYYAFHLDRQGRLWLRVGDGDNGFLHLFDTRTGRDSIVCPLGGYRSAVIPDKNGEVAQVLSSVLSTPGMEIVDLKDSFAKRAYFREGPEASTVKETFVENDTLVWLGLSNGIAAFNPQTGTSKVYAEMNDQPADDVWSVCPYGQHLLFVATQKKGLWLFDRRARRFTQQFAHEPNNPHSLLDDDVRNLFIDREENLWAAHWRYGLSYVNLRKNKFFIPPVAKGFAFWQFMNGPDGNIWCSVSRRGFFVFSPGGQLVDTVSNYFPELRRRINFTGQMYFPKEDGWGIYGNLLFEWERDRHRLNMVGQLPQRIMEVCVTPGGKTVAATAQGLSRLARDGDKGYTLTPFDLDVPFQPKNLSAVFCDSRGYLYVAENSERLLIFKETAEGLHFEKSIGGTGACKGFFETAGGQGVWVACTAGLLRIDPNLESRMLNETADGLPNATYYGVIADRHGRLWLSSNQGLLCYDPAQRSSRRYLPVDGLFGNEFNTGAFYQAADGKIWAGGLGGLVVFHPDSIRNLPFEPQVQFIKIFANDIPLKTEKQVEVLESLNLPYSQNTLSFEFVALEFSNPAANEFKYRLVGYDDNWVNSGTHGFARYANLPPGQYTFEVLATNSDGVWSTLPKRLKINIQTPFYKTWWFYLLCTLAVAGLIYAWFQYRLRQALKIERIRVQISSDLHDDVGTLLSGLAMQSEVLELTAPEKDKSKLRRIGEISRDAMARMRDTVWAIDARKDKLENLLDRMREHAEETLTPRGMRYQLQADNLNLKKNLPTNIRQNLYLIYKEAVTNAAKHSNGDTLSVILKKSGAGLEMHICDNGTAAAKNYKTTGSGTSNMQMRAEKIGGTLEIIRENGYCVHLRLPAWG